MKTEAILEIMDPIFPADFFHCSVNIPYAKDKAEVVKTVSVLPDITSLLDEERFASLSLAWNEESLMGFLSVEKPFESSFFPEYEKGDALELFIDTRDNKKAGFASRYCHQFVFLAGTVDGIQAQEITRFRSEDSHVLCDSTLIGLEMRLEKNGYSLFFTLPKEVLYGYDPLQFARIGFSYKIHRYKEKPMHFPFSSKSFDPLQNPSLWASLDLIKK